MKTNERFLEELKIIEQNIMPLEYYIGANTKIKVECLLCGHKWSTVPSSLIKKNKPSKCPVCHSRTKETYKKCLHNTHPQWSKHLKDSFVGERYSYGSKFKADWICPDCGCTVKNIPITKVVSRQSIPCKVCSDGISYPNKFMCSLLNQAHIEFISEYSPCWIKPKRYDFYIPSKNIIIEMDGNIGHGRTTFDGKTAIETLNVDTYKDTMALQNGIKVIRIDCIESDVEYIINNIIKSELSTELNLSNIDFLLCNSFANSSLKARVCELWNVYGDMSKILCETKLSRFTIIKYLKSCSKYGLCNYDPKEQMSKSGNANIAKAYNANKKSVICLETNKIFESCREVYRWLGYNIDGRSIQDNCKNITLSAGKHPETKQKLHWMFYSEYLECKGGV